MYTWEIENKVRDNTITAEELVDIIRGSSQVYDLDVVSNDDYSILYKLYVYDKKDGILVNTYGKYREWNHNKVYKEDIR